MIIDARHSDRALKARIWLGELPAWGFAPIDRIERGYPVSGPGNAAREEAAIELLYPPDKQQYAGLGTLASNATSPAGGDVE